mgnify:CR=1 FL=1
MKAVILKSKTGDWEALYVDGRCVAQDHRIRVGVLAQALGLDLEERVASDDADDLAQAVGRFPETLP